MYKNQRREAGAIIRFQHLLPLAVVQPNSEFPFQSGDPKAHLLPCGWLWTEVEVRNAGSPHSSPAANQATLKRSESEH
jgi:hypothetical protein